MTRLTTSFVLGYHGCDRDVGEGALAGEIQLLRSDHPHDWLGAGIYFWESDPVRAMEWAHARVKRGRAEAPSVVGAVIDLRNCLDLTQRANLDILTGAYAGTRKSFEAAGQPLPRNEDAGTRQRGDKLLRHLDCAVINYLHRSLENAVTAGADVRVFDTVRGLFTEGRPIYPGARFYRQTHTQIAVRSPECIVGLFRVPAMQP